MRRLAAIWPVVGGRKAPGTIVLALSSDKDATAILRALREGFPPSRLVATQSRSERALAADALATLATAMGFEAEALPDVGVAIRHALEGSRDRAVLLTGSLFVVGEAMELYGGAPGETL